MDKLDVPQRRLSSAIKRSYDRLEKEEFLEKYSPLSSTATAAEWNSPSKSNSTMQNVLDPTGKQTYYCLGIVAVAVAYFCWSIPLRTAFKIDQNVELLWIMLDTVAYSVYLLDIVIQRRTSYLHDGMLEQSIEKIRGYYSQSIYSKLDLISSFPMDWMYFVIFRKYPPPLTHGVKLLKVYRVIQFYMRTESRSHYPNICRVLILMHNLLVIIHWNACCYYLLSWWIGMGSDPWVYPCWNHTHNPEWGKLSRQYVYSFYWSTITLTTIGELAQPHTILEYLFMTLEYFIGILMFATLVGNVGSIISNVNKNKLAFQNKMDNVKTYMKTTKIPDSLQERVIKWFDYLWSYGDPMSEQHVLNALPDKLKAEIGIHVHFKTLKKVDLFKKCEQGLLWEVMLRLRTQVYSPGEFVCRKGDVGREMYIVNSGKLDVLEEENGIPLKELVHGEYFGEISVLHLGLGKSHRRRTAFIRSVGYTSLLCLTQADLFEVLNDYPKAKDILIENSKRLGYDNKSKDPIPLILSDEENSTSADFKFHDSTMESLPRVPAELHSVTDDIIHLKDRLTYIETLIHKVLTELKELNDHKYPPKEPSNHISSLPRYNEL